MGRSASGSPGAMSPATPNGAEKGSSFGGMSTEQKTRFPADWQSADRKGPAPLGIDGLADTEAGGRTPVALGILGANPGHWTAKTVEPGNRCHDSGPGARHAPGGGFAGRILDGPS
jgi:hypothetical protein